MDPGETVDLITLVRNYGTAASNVSGTLTSSDPYITIHNGSSAFGNIASGDTASNTSDPFSVEAASGAPTGHMADFMLVADAQGGTSDTSYFSVCIGRFHYFVWDPSPDMSSGPGIDGALKAAGYSGMISQVLPVTTLDSYSAVFVSVGIYADNYTIENGSPEAIALVNYLSSGGRMYLEGGDVWYYDPLYMNGYDFGTLFGINATSDGSGDLQVAQGQTGRFTDGMNFSYSGENNFIDHISPTGSAFLIFANSSPVYDCGVANDAVSYKTVGTSFEFAGLVDGSPPSTKEALADSIMRFFGLGLAVEEEPATERYPQAYHLSQNVPNPFATYTTITFAMPRTGFVTVRLYDASGRVVRSMVEEVRSAGFHSLTIDAETLLPGIYFIKLQTPETTLSRKCIVIK
jgi:hypothetical protein